MSENEIRPGELAAVERLERACMAGGWMAAQIRAEDLKEALRYIDRLTAERDAAVADAGSYKKAIDEILYTHANDNHRPRAFYIAARAIDAARSLDDSPMARMASALREKAAVERSQYDKRVQSGEWGPMPELGAEAVFCVACDGAGWDGDSRERTCQSCAGSGLAARSEGGV